MTKVIYGQKSDGPVHDFWTLFEGVCQAQPTAIAIRSPQKSSTYEELKNMATSLATVLADNGATCGQSIGFYLWHSESHVICTLACTYIGARFVPIDPSDPLARVEKIISNCGIRILISNSSAMQKVGNAFDDLLIVTLEDLLELDKPASTLPRSEIPLENASHILHTSGSTGEPKGVITSYRSWIHFCQYVIRTWRIEPADNILLGAPYTFDVSVMDMGVALLSGATLIVPSVKQQRHPPSLSNLIFDYKVTVAFLTQRLALSIDASAASSLRILMLGGERILAKTVRRWQLPTRRVVNIYGPTETTVAPIMKVCDPDRDADPQIGSPIDNHFVYLVDPHDRSRILAEGTGEIVIGGIGIARGYTTKQLHADPFSSFAEARTGYCKNIYYTGDHGYWDDAGDLIFVGRSDQQVKLNGVRVELNEIEAVLNQHPNVAVAIVLMDQSVQEHFKLRAIVKLASGCLEISNYLRYMEERLHRMKIPHDLVYVDEFQYTTSGKILRSFY